MLNLRRVAKTHGRDPEYREKPLFRSAALSYGPRVIGVVLYKEASYFLVNGCNHAQCGVDEWSIGTKRVGGAEGTWRDAEDGRL